MLKAGGHRVTQFQDVYKNGKIFANGVSDDGAFSLNTNCYTSGLTLNTLIASGLVLFAITLVVNMGARAVITRSEWKQRSKSTSLST